MSYMKELLLSLRSVMDLELGPWCTEVLSLLELKGWKVPPSTRLCLTLNALGHKGSIPGILGILKSSPNLKTLVIRGQSVPDNEVFITRDLAAAYLQNRTLDLVHLKTIMITGFTGEFLLCEPMLILVELLLKSANVLENMVISEEFVESSLSSDSTHVNEIALKLLTYPRASPKAVVVVR